MRFPNVGAVYDRPQFNELQPLKWWAVIARPYIGNFPSSEKQPHGREYVDRRAWIYLIAVVRTQEVAFAVEQILRIDAPFPALMANTDGAGKCRPPSEANRVGVVGEHWTEITRAETRGDAP